MEIITKCVSPWLQQRQEILTTLNNLAGVLPNNMYKDSICLVNFFQVLIDYTCAGHLQIFILLIKQSEKNCPSITKILKEINHTTNHIIKYNHKFNKFNNISAQDVVKLLEQFANRIELEDLLLGMQPSFSNHTH